MNGDYGTRIQSDIGHNGFPVSLNYFTALPDVSTLQNPTITIVFKSLLKKDATTKEKSLNDFCQLFDQPQHGEDLNSEAVIQAWTQVYPKLAFDNSRAVRVLSQNVQAKFLTHVGGKSFTKYLKSSLPIWLLSNTDSDKTVAKNGYTLLCECFQNDHDKVDKKIWQIFASEILHFIVVSLTLETKQTLSDERNTTDSDAVAKHERIMSGSLMLLNQLIQLINDPEVNLKLEQEELEQIENLLDNESLWDYMAIVFTPKTFNASMAMSYLLLLRSIFQEDKQTKNQQNKLCQTISSARSLYKHASKRFIKDIKIKPSRIPTNNIIYGSVILQFWGTLSVMTRFTQLEGKKKPKESMWELGGSKSDLRLADYIRLGPCNLDSVYFILLGRFLTVFVENSLINLQELKLDTTIIGIISSQLPILRGFGYKQTAIECLIEFIKVLPGDKQTLLQPLIPKLISVLNVTRGPDMKARDKCITLISQLLNDCSDEELDVILASENDKLLKYVESGEKLLEITAYSDLMLHIRSCETHASRIVQGVLEKLSETEEGSQIKRAFEILDTVLAKKLPLTNECLEELVEFTNGIGVYLEADSADFVMKYVFNMWKDPRFEGRFETFEMVDDLLTKCDMIGSNKSKFVKDILHHFNWSYQECLKSELLTEYLGNITQSGSRTSDEWDILFQFINNGDVFNRVLQNVKEEEELEFCRCFNKLSLEESEASITPDASSTETVNRLLKTSWQNYGECKNFIGFIESVASLKPLSGTSLWEYIKSINVTTDGADIWSLIDTQKQQLVLEKVEEELVKLPNIDKSVLAVSNSLGANIHLIEDSGSCGVDASLLGVCKVLANSKVSLDSPVASRLCYLCGVLSQYLQDFIFMMDHKQYSADSLLEIQQSLAQNFTSITKQVDLKVLLELLTGKTDSSNEVLSKLNQGLNTTTGSYLSYVARIFRDLIDNLSSSFALNTFDTLDIEFNPLLKNPLKLGIVLSGLSSFLSSQKFERIRNFVVAEILGVKSDQQILTDGLKWVILSYNFLGYSEDEAYEPIPSRRLNMVLLQFKKWLDSDVCYDDEFIKVRSQLLKFLSLVEPSNPDDETIAELTERLVEDNLSIIQVERNYELRYFTLKYLSTKKDLSEQTKEELFNNILLNEDIQNLDKEANLMVISMCHDVLERCFQKLTIKDISSDQVTKLYSLVTGESNYYQLKVIGCKLLHDHIIQAQQKLVLDYQFKRTDEDFDEDSIKLPAPLIEFTLKFAPHELNDDMTQFTYLLCWYLLLDHLKDINYLIRNQYFSQLRNNHKLLNNFLEYIFEVIEIDNIKIIDDFETFDLLNVTMSDKNLIMLHIYYLDCKYLGSEVQSWYNELRNIQLKQDIEKFTNKNVSSKLIGQMINDVESNKSKLVTDIMNIKINKVINEIKSSFTIDDQVMEMVIKIPNNFPLGNVLVEGSKRIGLTENEWKAWLLSSQRVISLTNGSIIEAIEIFKKNVDLHFSGFEECAICYSILHQDHSLPSKNCSTCSNKFHAACLYKWFKSSGSSTCPLCRSTFNFRK